MRFLIACVAIIGAFAGAYIYNLELNRSFLCNTFYLNLAKELLRNEKNEMLAFEEVFSAVYNDMFEYKEIDTTETALNIVDTDIVYAIDAEYISSLLKNYLSCGQNEIIESENILLNTCQKAYDKSKNQKRTNGKTAYILCPGITLIILIILI